MSRTPNRCPERGRLPASARPERVSLNPTAWLAGPDMGLAQWVENGRRLALVGRAVGWWIGDWLRYGNERFGERYARAARITGYDPQTLMNMVYVASRFDLSRRREELSFSHHAELAALDPDAQDYWLSRARAERLSVRCLREELRRERRALRGAERAALAARSTLLPEDIVCPECGCRFGRAEATVEVDGQAAEAVPAAA